ncbi:Protein kinase-like domain protein [Niveomyces insectorum RCEF 264]|uniref:Protein kinase-like domain protein n=1 Tax=Niveomyces insectorum RCEF 264 TaxID=1081102 RepID=A0A167XU16_9HYPO|nr:Protein kinase-like domain protein [Niveomyces insectorum RCEF 264]
MSHNSSFSNAYCVAERRTPAADEGTEPMKVFIKLFTAAAADMEVFKDLVPNKLEEALLCAEFGRSGQGAKVYGLCKTLDGTLVRIDEFLDARNMEPEDAEDPSVRADVARALATFHTMNAPLDKKAVERFYEALLGGLEKYHGMDTLEVLGKDSGANIDNLVDYDFAMRLLKVVERLKLLGGKSGWKYEEDEKRHFCDVYARQWNALTGDADAGDLVFLESKYGCMLAIAFNIHNMLCAMCEDGDKDPLDLLRLNKLFEEFAGQKAPGRLQLTLKTTSTR